MSQTESDDPVVAYNVLKIVLKIFLFTQNYKGTYQYFLTFKA